MNFAGVQVVGVWTFDTSCMKYLHRVYDQCIETVNCSVQRGFKLCSRKTHIFICVLCIPKRRSTLPAIPRLAEPQLTKGPPQHVPLTHRV